MKMQPGHKNIEFVLNSGLKLVYNQRWAGTMLEGSTPAFLEIRLPNQVIINFPIFIPNRDFEEIIKSLNLKK